MITEHFDTKWGISLCITSYIFSAIYCYKRDFTWGKFLITGFGIYIIAVIGLVITDNIHGAISKKKL